MFVRTYIRTYTCSLWQHNFLTTIHHKPLAIEISADLVVLITTNLLKFYLSVFFILANFLPIYYYFFHKNVFKQQSVEVFYLQSLVLYGILSVDWFTWCHLGKKCPSSKATKWWTGIMSFHAMTQRNGSRILKSYIRTYIYNNKK